MINFDGATGNFQGSIFIKPEFRVGVRRHQYTERPG
jgi:hypothetical protein